MLAEAKAADSLLRNYCNVSCAVITAANINTKQKHLGCEKGEANQKQQLSDYSYIAILATKNFDIS